MKKHYIFIVLLFIVASVQAQIVTIPDANFKNELLNNFPVIDINNDGEIQETEASTITYLNLANEQISDLTGIEAFTSLITLDVRQNQLTSLDFSSNTALFDLDCGNNMLTSINFGAISSIEKLDCKNNQLVSLDLSNLLSLKELDVSYNLLSILDLSNHNEIYNLYAYSNNISTFSINGAAALVTASVGKNNLTQLNLLNCPLLESFDASFNLINSVNTSGAPLLRDLSLRDNQINSIDLMGNQFLQDLDCSFNLLTSLDLSTNNFLEDLNINNNQFTSIDAILNNTTSIITLYANNNALASLNLSTNASVQYLYLQNNNLTNLIGNNTIIRLDCTNNNFTTLDLSQDYANMSSIVLDDNTSLEYINFKNGQSSSYFYNIQIYNFGNLTSLQAVCVDNINAGFPTWIQAQNSQQIIFTEYCSFTPGGAYYTINGNTRVDLDSNGCDVADLAYSNLLINITNGTNNDAFLGNETGAYNMPVQAGNYTITPQLENPSYFNITPASTAINFPTDTSPNTQDFCITANGVHDDLEIILVPIQEARPGFNTYYKIIYKNKGNTTLSGSIDFLYNDDYMDLFSVEPMPDSQSTGNLVWNYTGLEPFQTREIEFTMTLNTPTDATFPLNGDDVLNFNASITPNTLDQTPNDNLFTLNQIVVNAYDPNDKTCLEGNTIAVDRVGEFVHYLIRFENTGTASAINVVVKDNIDTTKYNLSSLVPLDASHDFETRIRNENEVEFIFENIQLPFDDANNDGYVLFKIQTLPTLVVGDTFSNQAEIYFDFNFPIITNLETTIVEEVQLSVDNFTFNSNVKLYPNPTGNYFSIKTLNGVAVNSVKLFDISGKQLLQFNAATNYNITRLQAGIYFLKIKTNKGEINKRIVKK